MEGWEKMEMLGRDILSRTETRGVKLQNYEGGELVTFCHRLKLELNGSEDKEKIGKG
jgi:hypothetical protein